MTVLFRYKLYHHQTENAYTIRSLNNYRKYTQENKQSSLLPGCQSSYIGKTDRTLLTRKREHAVTDKESAIYKHLRTCKHLALTHNLFNLPDTLNNITSPTISCNNDYANNVVQNNTTVLDYANNWNLLLFKEPFHIKRQSPSLNNRLKPKFDDK